MELARRRFFVLLVAALAGLPAILRESPPIRWLRARVDTSYPGPVARLDREKVKQPAKWLG